MYITADGRFVGRDDPDAVKKVFDSEKEFRRWCDLLVLLEAGKISGLRRGRRFDLHGPNGTKLTYWRSDFTYIQDGTLILEDVKSAITRKIRVYQIKKAWVKDEYGFDILET